MKIPNWPKTKLLGPNGELHPSIDGYFDQLTVSMQTNLSDEGFRVPNQPTTNISQLVTNIPSGNLVYDATTNELKVLINGTYKVIQTA